MYSIAIILYSVGVTLSILAICWAASTPCPRAHNRRGGRLGKWLKFHGGVK